MTQCNTYTHSRALQTPFTLDRAEPGETLSFSGDVSDDLDCAGAGITLTNVTADIRAADDDGELSLGIVTFDAAALTFRVPYTVAPTAEDAMYGVTVTVTTSDGRVVAYRYAVQVRATRYPWD